MSEYMPKLFVTIIVQIIFDDISRRYYIKLVDLH